MRRRLYLEWGYVAPGEEVQPTQQVSIDPEPHYQQLVDARKNLVDATTKGDNQTIDNIRNWLGGAIAMYASLFDQNAKEILSRLESEHPIPKYDNPYAVIGDFVQVESERPKPHPGAPKPVDPEVLAVEQSETPEL